MSSDFNLIISDTTLPDIYKPHLDTQSVLMQNRRNTNVMSRSAVKAQQPNNFTLKTIVKDRFQEMPFMEHH